MIGSTSDVGLSCQVLETGLVQICFLYTAIQYVCCMLDYDQIGQFVVRYLFGKCFCFTFLVGLC